MTNNAEFYPQDFLDKIEKAMDHIYSLLDIEELTNKEQFLARQFTYGDISGDEFEKEIIEIQKKTPSLIVLTLLELDMVLKYVGIDKKTRKCTQRELQLEIDQAANKGYQSRFAIWFYLSLNESYAMYCGHQILVKSKKNNHSN